MKNILLLILLCYTTTLGTNTADIDCESYLIQKYVVLEEMIVYPVKENEVYDIAKLIGGEATNEPEDGQIAVANVVINRARHKGISVYKAIRQPGIFDGYGTRHWKRTPRRDALHAARMALKGYNAVPETVHYFHNPIISTDLKHTRYISKFKHKQIGGHLFCHHPDLIKSDIKINKKRI